MKIIDLMNTKKLLDNAGETLASEMRNIERKNVKDNQLFITYHSHYNVPAFSIYLPNNEDKEFDYSISERTGVQYMVDATVPKDNHQELIEEMDLRVERKEY